MRCGRWKECHERHPEPSHPRPPRPDAPRPSHPVRHLRHQGSRAAGRTAGLPVGGDEVSADLRTLLDTDPAAGLRGVAALMRARAEAVSYPTPWEIGGGTCGVRSNGGRNYVASTYGGVGTEEAAARHIAAADPAFVL